MKRLIISAVIGMVTICSIQANGQQKTTPMKKVSNEKPDPEQVKKATEWVNTLHLNSKQKEEKVIHLIAYHLKTIRDWHNSHSYKRVPAGINPETGAALSQLDRQIIIDSSIPDSVHTKLMKGLQEYLNQQQVEKILDKYTVGKVDFTMKAYETIVPDLTQKEKSVILKNLKDARERAIDYKNMKEISAIFGIYKTKNEHYLNTHGRNWRDLYQAYYDKVHNKK